jgi:hypothetical protein
VELLNYGDGTEAGGYWSLILSDMPDTNQDLAWHISRENTIRERNERSSMIRRNTL